MFGEFLEAFHGKGHKYYKSKEAQRKFAESTMKMAEMLFLAPIAYLISVAWSGEPFQGWVLAFVVVFMVLGLKARHDSLKMYDDINEPDTAPDNGAETEAEI
ncbi:hypothetical protein [Marinobacter sp. GH_1]|uniref:hypothetical protein n=1 Tax=Marinobacter sp. GH_1 TaxID=3402164 RepID=UPI003B4385EC